MIDILKHRDAIEAINAIINNKGVAEIKEEKNGLTVVEINRKVKLQKQNNDRQG